MRTEDGHIISKCLKGDSAAFGFLVDKYKASIYAFAYDRLQNFHDAEDVTQEVFLKAYQKLRTLKRYDSFLAWLYSMTSNACKMLTRARSRRPDSECIEDISLSHRPSVDSYREQQNRESLHESLREALNSLPEMYRQALTLHYLGGMSSKEIAMFVGASPAAIRKRLSKARSLLKKEMLAVMNTTFEEQRLQAAFTFRIVQAVKRIKIQPMPRMTGLPWGLSLAAGIIVAVLSLNPHLGLLKPKVISASSLFPVDGKAPKTGEIPVDILETSQVSIIVSGQEGSNGVEFSNPNNPPFLAPRAEGGKWAKKADMPTARSGLSVSVVNGKIYAVGGLVPGNRVVSTVEEYDPATDTWTKKTDMSIGRHGLVTCAVNGRIYAIDGSDEFVGWFVSPVEEYDPKKDEWKKKTDLPLGRKGLSACSAVGKIYVIGGWWMKLLSAVNEYDPATDTWARKADMPTARLELSTCAVNGRIYAIGGWMGQDDVPPLSTVEEYNPEKDMWIRKADMPTARWNLATSVVNGRIYAIGGYDGERTLSIVEEYDPEKDVWTRKADMPTARSLLSAGLVGGKIYAIGGTASDFGPTLSIVEEYDPGFVSDSKSVEPKGKVTTPWAEIKSY